jgi:hypothetical protein
MFVQVKLFENISKIFKIYILDECVLWMKKKHLFKVIGKKFI